jgi:uncharacterized protein (DUF433 family)
LLASFFRGLRAHTTSGSDFRSSATRFLGYDLHMDYRDRIVVDPAVRFGKPTVRGTRITAGDVLSYLASGMSEDEILSDFPQLAREDLRACLAFAAERERRLASVPGR